MACPPRRFVSIHKTADDAQRVLFFRQFSLIPTGEVPLNRLREDAVAVPGLRRSARRSPRPAHPPARAVPRHRRLLPSSLAHLTPGGLASPANHSTADGGC